MPPNMSRGAPPSDANLESLFKTKAGYEEFFQPYDSLMSAWPPGTEQLDVKTDYGITHLNLVGPSSAEPLFLLPGFGANSTIWFANIEALSKHFRVYAVDTPGQPGRSIPTVRLTASMTSHWLRSVMDGLAISRAHFVGVSLGGWIVFDFAIRQPGLVGRMVLLDPAASLAPISPSFLWHSLFPIMIHPTRKGLVRYFQWLTRGKSTDRRWGEHMIQGILDLKPAPPIRPKPFTDAQLSRCTVPTLLLIGEESVIYNPTKALGRARDFMPSVEARIVEDASHGLNYERADFVNSSIITFLKCSSGAEETA